MQESKTLADIAVIKERISELFRIDESLRFGSVVSENTEELTALKSSLLDNGITAEELEKFIRDMKLQAEKEACEIIKLQACYLNSPQAALIHNFTKIQGGIKNAWFYLTGKGKSRNLT